MFVERLAGDEYTLHSALRDTREHALPRDNHHGSGQDGASPRQHGQGLDRIYLQLQIARAGGIDNVGFSLHLLQTHAVKNKENAKNDASSLLLRLTVPFSIVGTELALSAESLEETAACQCAVSHN